MSQASEDVLAERERQKAVEGWTEAHDNVHRSGEIADAAACYATASLGTYVEREWVPPDKPAKWPWHISWWKPRSRRSNLVRAGALIIAEIERLDRLAAKRGEA